MNIKQAIACMQRVSRVPVESKAHHDSIQTELPSKSKAPPAGHVSTADPIEITAVSPASIGSASQRIKNRLMGGAQMLRNLTRASHFKTGMAGVRESLGTIRPSRLARQWLSAL